MNWLEIIDEDDDANKENWVPEKKGQFNFFDNSHFYIFLEPEEIVIKGITAKKIIRENCNFR